MNRERNRVMHARAKGEYDVHPDIDALRRVLREFRLTAVALGGLLIKLGQFLSARADLLPQAALDEIAQLQDKVPAESFAGIRKVVERELGAPLSEVFRDFDHVPAGAASLGQVHRAQLLDGRTIALKVQRPGIHDIVHTDLRTLRFVLNVVGLYREFSRTVYEELDYQREGRNAERFAIMFASEPDVIVPKVLWEYTTHRVLALEWMDGIKVGDVEALVKADVDRDAVALRIVRLYFRQVLEDGFFHADPHPGNIFVQPGTDGTRLVFVDFGMVGTITSRMKRAMIDAMIGIVQQDARLVVRALNALGFLGEEAQLELIEQAIGILLARFGSMPFGQLRETDPSEVAGDVEELLYDQPFRLPSQFAFLGRAIGMLVGLATSLSPSFNFIDAATPYARQMIQQDGVSGFLRMFGVESVQALGRDVVREGISVARSMSSIPRTLERVLERAERGDLRLIIESPSLDPQLRNRVGRRVATNMLNKPVPVWVPVSMAGALVVLLAARRRDHHG
jgi:predicted unusual protein kinase regulating ubiquinone biosynthesis (AarF/ABC1/UbiB family)